MSDIESPLLPYHLQLLQDAGITEEVIAARRYRSLETQAEVRRLGFTNLQALVPCLLIPLFGADGEIVTYLTRPDVPRIWRGQLMPFEMPASGRTVIDVPPSVRDPIPDATAPLVIAASVLDADALASHGLCAISLHGTWLLPQSQERRPSLPNLTGIALEGRTVVLAMDRDARVLDPLAAQLREHGATVQVWQPEPGDAVSGIGAALAAGQSMDDLLAEAVAHQPAPPPAKDAAVETQGPYRVIDGCITWIRPFGDNESIVRLCNFTAEIREEIIADNGQTERGELIIAGRLARGPRFPDARVPTTRFESLQWVTANWGTGAIIAAGQGNRDRLREAIQRLSPAVERRREYTHPGWRRLHGTWCFLTQGAVIGPDGAIDGLAVRLDGPASMIRLPVPPDPVTLRTAIQAALRLLDLAPDRIMIPLLGAVFRAILNSFAPADVVIFLVGPSGVLKSELAAAIQRFFGPDFDRLRMPATWTATANALERIAFDYKDCLLVIDDFAPAGTTVDVRRYHLTADRVIRGAGNATGRERMQADGSIRDSYPPRALILSTGEDVPTGYSIRARMLVLEVSRGDIDSDLLEWFQTGERPQLQAQMLAGFIRWIARHIDDLKPEFGPTVNRLRTQLQARGTHARTPEALAGIGMAWQLWIRFALESDVFSVETGAALWGRVERALREIARSQQQHLAQENPVDRFLDLLRAVIASGAAHVAGPDGQHPESTPEAWGWRQRSFENHISTTTEWQPQGERIGWIDAEGLYLQPQAAYQAVQRFGTTSGTTLALSASTLWKRLDEARLLVTTDQATRGTLRVRRQLGGARNYVLHLAPTVLDAQEDHNESGDPGPTQSGAGRNGQVPGAGWVPSDGDAAHTGAEKSPRNQGDGHIGQVGQRFEAGPRTVATTCARCGIRRTVPPTALCPQCEEADHDSAA